MRRIVPLFALAACVLASLAAPAAADEPEMVPVQVACRDDRLVALRLLAPRAGVITLQISPDVCDRAEPATEPRQPVPEERSPRTHT